MTIHDHTTSTHRPIELLPASFLHYRAVFHQTLRVRTPDVLILCPERPIGIGAVLRRIADAFRARGKRVALWQVSRHGGSRPMTSEMVGKEHARRGGRNYRDMGGRIHIRTDNTDNEFLKLL